MHHRIFIYGTLKRGFPNHGHLDGATFLGEARTVEAYPMIVQGLYYSPVLLPEPGLGQPITGELWEVDGGRLAALDRLESTHLPIGYIRETIRVEAGGAVLTAEAYFKPRERIEIVHSEPLADYQDRRYVPAHLRPR
jgi:gamma-glutamylaminecyclotransferase